MARDPYDVLGILRGASLEEIKAAYRRASKQRHPDVGGTTEAMAELNAAYDFILKELKSAYERQQQEQAKRGRQSANDDAWSGVGAGAGPSAKDETYWRDLYRDIDEELETLRRGAEQHDKRLRAMRRAAWETGERAAWAKLTCDDLLRFLQRTARSGVKGLALLFAALVGVGSVLVEANLISAIILLGSGIGFAISLAIQSDKGGFLSAALLLFGVMTIWLPPVQSAFYHFPLATLSVLILLALIFKFAQAAGTVGMMTGGLLALYVIFVVLNDTTQHPGGVGYVPPPQITPPSPTFSPPPTQPFPSRSPAPESSATPQVPPSPASPPEPRTLLAADGAILKFVAGVPYHLKVRTGRSTTLRATHGTVRYAANDNSAAGCFDSLEFSDEHGSGPWRDIEQTIYGCNGDATLTASIRR